MKQKGLKRGVVIDADIHSYRILYRIGAGSFGNVYKAVNVDTLQVVAIKVLKYKEGMTSEYKGKQLKRFVRELRICAHLSHPNIVKLLDKGWLNVYEPFGVFEYVYGRTLKDVLLKDGIIPAFRIKKLMGQFLNAIIYMHAKDVIHRDLKPQNIMVTCEGDIKILDFGISAFFSKSEYGNKDEGLSIEEKGTPAYAICQQLKNGTLTPMSDIYSWGLMLIECITGVPVFKNSSLTGLIQHRLNQKSAFSPSTIFKKPLAALLNQVLHEELSPGFDYNSFLTSFESIDFSNVVCDNHLSINCQHAYLETPTIISCS